MRNTDQFSPLLRRIGLNESEIQVYLSALTMDSAASSGTLAKRANLKPSTTTLALQSLIGKGLISYLEQGTKVKYCAEPPGNILQLLNQRHREIAALHADVELILPELDKLISPFQKKPRVRVFEGIRAVQQLLLGLIELHSEVLSIANLYEEEGNPFQSFWEAYFQEIERQDKWVRLITPNNADGQAFQKADSKHCRETRLLPVDLFPVGIEKHIVGGTVTYMSRCRDSMVGILIEDGNIAEAEMESFELMWSLLDPHS